MGLVIDKTVQILKLVASRDHQTLTTLCEATGSKKSALCQTLQSLVANGLLQKNNQGVYQLGPLLFELTAPRTQETQLLEAVDAISADLNNACGESVTIATLRNGKYRRLISRSCVQAIRISSETPDEDHFYSNATGRILLAYATAEMRQQIVSRLGLPAMTEWREAATSPEALSRELDTIRSQHYAELCLHNGEIRYLAVCAMKPDEATPIAIGISVPGYRYNQQTLLRLLNQAKEQLETYR